MSKQFDDRLKVCRIILKELKGNPCRWTPLCKATLDKSPTPWMFRSALEWLLEKGYVDHEYRETYMITDRGRAFLEAL